MSLWVQPLEQACCFSIFLWMPPRKYSWIWLIVLYEQWLILSGESQPHLAPCEANCTANISVKFSLLLLQLSKSLVQCSIQGNFHSVVKAVFFNFLASLSFYLPPIHLIPSHVIGTLIFASPHRFLPTCVTCLEPQCCWGIIHPGLCSRAELSPGASVNA